MTAAGAFDVALNAGATIDQDTNFINTGNVTLGDDGADVTTFTGGLSTTSAANTFVAGTVATTAADLDLGAATLTADALLSTAGGDLGTGAITSGGNHLQIDSGAGDATLASFGGGGDLTVVNSGDTTVSGALLAGTVTLTDSAGTIRFAGDTTIATDLVTTANGYDVAFGGTTNTIAGAGVTTFLNTGSVSIGDGPGDSTQFTQGVNTQGGPAGTQVAGTITTGRAAGQDITFGATTLIGDATLIAGAGLLNLTSVTNGLANFGLTVQDAAATGAVSIGGFQLGSLTTAAGAYDVSLLDNGTVTGDTNFNNTGDVTLGDNGDAVDVLNFNGGLDTRANTETNIAALVQTVNTQMDLGNVVLDGATTLRSGAGALTIASVREGAGAQTLTLQNAGATGTVTVAGDITVDTLATTAGPYTVELLGGATITTDTAFINTGSVTLGDDTGDVTTFVGGLDTTATASTSAAGTLATTATAMDLNALTLSAQTTLVTGSAPITIAAVDGAGQTLNAQQIGATGAFTVNGGFDVGTLNTFAGAYDVSLLGGGSVATATTFANTGDVVFGDDTGDEITFTGGVDTTTAAATRLAGELSTTNTPMVLGATTLTADAEIDSGAGAINIASVAGPAQRLSVQSATSTGAVTVAGDLTVDALTTFAGNYALSLLGGATVAQDTTFQNLGTVTLGDDAADATRFVGGLDTVNSASTIVQGSVLTTNADIDLGATTLAGDTTVVGGAGAVDFVSATDGGNGFTLSVQNATATGAVRFLGDADLGALATFGGAYDLALLGGGTIDADTTFANSGIITLGDGAADTTVFVGGLDTRSAATTNVAGVVRSTNTAIDLGNAALTDTTTIASGAGALTLADVTGATELLTLQEAGATGAVTVGGTFALGQLVTGAGAFDTTLAQSGTVAGTTTLSNSGLNTIGDAAADTFGFVGGLDATAGTSSLFGAFSSNNAPLQFGDAALAGNSSFTTASGDLAFGVLTGAGNALTIDAANGALTMTALNGAGAVALTEAETTTVTDDFSATSLTLGGGTTFAVGGNLAVTDAILNQDIDVFTVSGTTTAGSFQSDAQDGQLTFVGDTAIGGAFTLNNGASALDGFTAATFNGALSASSVSVAANPIAVQFDGNVAVSGAGAFNNTSGVILGNSGDSAAFGAGLTVAGPLSVFANVSSAGGAITLAGATTQTGSSSFATGGGAITAAAIDSVASDLALDAGGGTISLTSVAGAGTLAVSNASTVTSSGGLAATTFDLNSANSFEVLGAIDFGTFDSSGTAGAIRLAGGGTVSTAAQTVFSNAGGLTVDTADVAFGGALNTAGTTLSLGDAGLLTNSGAITTGTLNLIGDGRLDSTNGLSPAGGADITLGGATSGAFAIELFAGSGAVDVQGPVNTGSLFVRSGGTLNLGDVTTSGNTTRGFVTGDITLNGAIVAEVGDVILVTIGGTLTQVLDGDTGSTIVANQGDVILGAKDSMRINNVATPQGSILLTLLGPAEPGVARSILRQQGFGAGGNDLVTGSTGTIAVTASEAADFGDVDNGFLLDGGSLFASVSGGNIFIESSNASPQQNLDPTLRNSFTAALDPVTGQSFSESTLDPVVFNSISGVLTNAANATANRTASVSDSEGAQAQLSEEEEDLTNLSEDVFQDITLVNADQQPLCLPDALQGFDGAACAGGDSVAEWADEVGGELVRQASARNRERAAAEQADPFRSFGAMGGGGGGF